MYIRACAYFTVINFYLQDEKSTVWNNFCFMRKNIKSSRNKNNHREFIEIIEYFLPWKQQSQKNPVAYPPRDKKYLFQSCHRYMPCTLRQRKKTKKVVFNGDYCMRRVTEMRVFLQIFSFTSDSWRHVITCLHDPNNTFSSSIKSKLHMIY